MAKPRPPIRDQLAAATAERALVRIDRTIKGADRLDGFLVGSGLRWALIHQERGDWRLNGYVAFRVADVKRVKFWDDKAGYPARALAYFNQHAVPQPDIDLGSTSSLVESAAQVFPLLTIHVEATDPSVCYVGRPTTISKRTLWLLEIDPGALWASKPSTWDLGTVTRVDFGSRYQEALLAIGGEPEAR